jgi:hypothetical protein
MPNHCLTMLVGVPNYCLTKLGEKPNKCLDFTRVLVSCQHYECAALPLSYAGIFSISPIFINSGSRPLARPILLYAGYGKEV